jgi:hypothetical protein
METITLARRQKQQFGKARILNMIPRHTHILRLQAILEVKKIETLLKRAANLSL